MTNFKSLAQNAVDHFVSAGLDCGALVHRRMEKTIVVALKEIDRDVRHAAADIVSDVSVSAVYKSTKISQIEPRMSNMEKAKSLIDAFVEQADLDCNATLCRRLENILVGIFDSVLRDSKKGCFDVARRHTFSSNAHNEIMNLVS
jgi:hypothetical protein